MNRKSIILSIKGLRLSKEEYSLIQNEKPWGIILFKRNIKNINQLKSLTSEIKKAMNDSLYPILIDEEGVVRHAVLNDLPLGRNIDEMLRMIDALAFHAKNGDVCPANWQEGKTAMKASDEGMRKYMAAEADNL